MLDVAGSAHVISNNELTPVRYGTPAAGGTFQRMAQQVTPAGRREVFYLDSRGQLHRISNNTLMPEPISDLTQVVYKTMAEQVLPGGRREVFLLDSFGRLSRISNCFASVESGRSLRSG